ncbi:MAG: Tn3 family transposase [Sterolibacterium sp.]
MGSYEMRYVGLDRLPSKLSDFDLERYFSLTNADIAAVSERFRADRRAGASVQLVFLRASGRPLDHFGTIPRQLLHYVGMRLGVVTPTIASLKTIYGRYKTLYDHQVWAREYLGLSVLDDVTRDDLNQWMCKRAQEALSLDELLQDAVLWLYEQRIVIPAERTLRDTARSAWATIEKDLLSVVQQAIPSSALADVITKLGEILTGSSMTRLEWLKSAPKRHSPSTLNETLEKIRYLKGLGVHDWILETVPLDKQRAYAQLLQARRPAKTRELKESRLTLELVCFLRITLLELTDSALYQSGRRVRDLVRGAYTKAQSKQARNAIDFRRRLVDIKVVVENDELPAEARLAAIRQMLSDVESVPSASHAAIVREALAEDGTRIKALLNGLSDLEFAGTMTDKGLKQLTAVRQLHAAGVTELPVGTDQNVGKAWQHMVDDPDRKRALRALEACAMMNLRKGLRGGSIWVRHSLSFRERNQMLIPPEQWTAESDSYLTVLGLQRDPEPFLGRLLENIKAGLTAVNEAREAGKIDIGSDGMLHLSALASLPDDIDPKHTRDRVFKQIGDIQLPDLMLQMDALTNFSEILLARRPRDENELIGLYGALLAHGTEVDAKGVAAMTPQLDAAQISAAMRILETPSRLYRASNRVVEFQRKHAITELWGTGESASADMMSLDASKHLWNARVDPRRRQHAAGIYTHVLDQHGIVYNQPIVLNERQNGPAIEGLVRYNNSRERNRLSMLAVDTHGYSHVGMAVANLLSFDLCPRLRNLAERKLYLPRGFDAPEGIEGILAREVSIKAIRAGWDELLRLVASIHSGRVSANVALQRFGSAAQGDPLHRAAENLGKLLRTLFLCDYFSNEEFRREIHTILNRGESVHQLQRAVYYGKIPPERGRRKDEMIAISGAHTLLTNLVIAWNTHQMQSIINGWRKSGIEVDDAWIRRMGPAHFGHINFRGTFKFSVGRYAELIFQPAQQHSKRAS